MGKTTQQGMRGFLLYDQLFILLDTHEMIDFAQFQHHSGKFSRDTDRRVGAGGCVVTLSKMPSRR
jgi:hypothetical protein